MSDDPSYIDYEAFLSPNFSPHSFANDLILSTNNPTDTTLDLSTPLSRVLFDVQEIDTHIHNLTTKEALPILDYVRGRDEASKRILGTVEADVGRLRRSYERLEKEVLERYEQAEQMRVVSLRSLEVLRLAREVGRAVGLGRQLEIQVSEAGLNGTGRASKEDHRAMVRAVYTILEFRDLLEQDVQGRGLQRINVVTTLQTDLFATVEERIKGKAQQIVREFSISNITPSATTTTTTGQGGGSSTATFLHTEDAKSRTTSAVTILYLLSPIGSSGARTLEDFRPDLLLNSLQSYLQNNLTSSLAAISRALATLPTLERTLVEVSARCQNVVALEVLLSGTKPPHHPSLNPSSKPPRPEGGTPRIAAAGEDNSLLTPLLNSLDTPSLPSYFWRSLASGLSSRVQEIVNRGGVSARTLRSNRERVGSAMRECVMRGSELPVGVGGRGGGDGKGGTGRAGDVGDLSWEREAAVMVGSVVGILGR